MPQVSDSKFALIRRRTSCAKLARLQLEAGAIGLTVAKVGEAEVISDPEQDVLMAYPPVGEQRAERLAVLARDRTVARSRGFTYGD